MISEYSDIGSYIQEQEERQLKSQKKTVLKNCIEEGHKSIARDDYETLYIIVKDGLEAISPLQQDTKRMYYQECEERGLDFDWTEYNLFSKNSDEYTDISRKRTQRLLEGCFTAHESALSIEGIVDSDAEQTIDVIELGDKVGERKVSATSTINDEQVLIDDSDYPGITFVGGGTGSGKSTYLEKLTLSRYYNGEKIIDLHDTVEGENILYDVKTDDDELLEIRRKLGLQNEFEKKPNIDILLPLTKNLDGKKVTQKPDGESLFRTFTVPASEISKESLLLLVDTTKAQRKYLEDAYDNLEGDWILEDLAEAVKDTGARSDVVDRLQSAIKSLQQKGWIRDCDDPNILDWKSIFQDTDTITSLTTMYVESRAESIVLTVYILSKIISERENMKATMRNKSEIPDMTLSIREIHNLAPSKSERSTGRLGDIQKHSIKKMKELSSYHRHLYMRVLADAQLLGKQVDPSIQSMAHRIYQFSSQYQSVNRSFNTRVRVDNDVIQSVANYDTGKCALIDSNGYTMPIVTAPPINRHFDTHTDVNGWAVRADLTNEEYTNIDVNTELPERFVFDLEDEDKKSPVEVFVEKSFIGDSDSYIHTIDIEQAYRTWAISNQEGMDVSKKEIIKTVRKVYNLDDSNQSRRNYRGNHSDSDRQNGYWGIKWTDYGSDYDDSDNPLYY